MSDTPISPPASSSSKTSSTSAAPAPEVNVADREFPVPFKHFHKHHLHKTHDHVFARLLQSRHPARAYTITEWKRHLDALRNEPAYRPGV